MRGLTPDGGIVKAQLDAGAAVPVVQLQLAGQVKASVAGVFQRGAEGAVEGTERDGVKGRA